jgi:pimeloyl-ACP methyl ester carboxylesterase
VDVIRLSTGGALAVDRLPGWRATPVLLLHGGGQTRHAWGATAEDLAADGWPTVSADLRGHGDSAWAADGDYSIEAFGRDVAELAADCASPPVLVGASLGGLSSLLALTADPPAAAAGLVLVDVAHRYELDGAKRIVHFMGAKPEGFGSVADASAAVAAYLPHRSPPGRAEAITRNLRRRDGRWRWHWDPALLDESSSLLDPSEAATRRRRLERAVARLTVPTLLVRGGMSDVVTPQIADEFVALAPDAQVVDVAGARHMVAGDSNAAFTAAVLAFLEDRVAPG